jgi:NitT/TauT family transport system permease protein
MRKSNRTAETIGDPKSKATLSLTLIGTILGEMFGSQRGLGYLLMTAIGLNNVQVIMSVTLLLVLVAATANTLLLRQDRRLRNPGGTSFQKPD